MGIGVRSDSFFQLAYNRTMTEKNIELVKQDTPIERLLKRFKITQILISTFLVLIIVGTILLSLPVSNLVKPASLIDNLFVAVSAVCVTGLSPITVATQYNLLGKTVLILLMQFGGLGLMTFIALAISLSSRHLSFSELQVFAGAAGMNSVYQVRSYIRHIVKYTLFFEGCGWLLLSFAFIPEYGIGKGIFNALFLSISSFTNAGFDPFSPNSLVPYQSNLFVNLVVMALIIVGGLGFMVWMEIFHKRKFLKRQPEQSTGVRNYSLHTRLVLRVTTLLIVSAAAMILLLEWNNPLTIGNANIGTKIIASLFQSVTLRTAGFMTVVIGNLRPATRWLMLPYMLIGGSPGGTAGGFKTTTFAIIVIMVYNRLHGNEGKVLKRKIKSCDFATAVSLISIYFLFLFIGMIILLISDGINIGMFDLLFEAVSAIATVGLSAGITSALSPVGKLAICLLMFAGRVGPVAIISSFQRKSTRQRIQYPDGDIMLG